MSRYKDWTGAGCSLAALLATLATTAVIPRLGADVVVSPLGEGRTPFRREVVGVNHLAYGRNGRGYGMILPHSHELDPQLVAWQKEIGFGSLRYPGGCGGTHRFEWKRNAGLSGAYSVMGVVEFLGMCESAGATPILGISAHRGSPEEAAEYVEFLNAPADASHPWAQKRAERGHPKPYGAVWFEYGNETYHGMTCSTYKKGAYPVRDITPDDYCDSYLAFREAMRAVDSRIKLGAPLCGGGSLWDKTVLARLGRTADFFVVHSYANVPERSDGDGFAALFCDRTEYLRGRFDEIKAAAGPNAAVAVTEFGARITQHKTLAAALVNLSTLMDFATEPCVVHADYWQFVNEGFGMVRGERGNFVKRPSAWAFQLFSRYTLGYLVPADVVCDAKPLGGALHAIPEGWTGRNAMDGVQFRFREGGTAEATGTRYTLLPGGVHRVDFVDDRLSNFYQLQAKIGGLPKGNQCNWRVSYEMWTEQKGARAVEASLEIVDGRGWGATKSAMSGDSVSGIDPVHVSFDYSPLEDNPGSLLLRFRRTGAGAGSVYVRGLRVEAVPRRRLEGSAVRAQMSVSPDSNSVCGVFINRSFERQKVCVDVSRLLKGDVGSVSGEVLSGPSAYATNEEDPHAVELRRLDVAAEGGRVSFMLAPHSAAGVCIKATLPFKRSVHMDRHDILSDGFVRVTYSNGAKIYVNYTDETKTVDGTTVPTRDYVVVR